MTKNSTQADASDFLLMRMECTARAGATLLDRIEAENRPRTRMERAEITLLTLDQESRQRRWVEAVIEEGKKPQTFRPFDSPTNCYVSNANRARPAVYLFGSIGERYGGVTATEFQQELAKIPDNQPIDLHINSDGGSYSDGLAIRSLLASRPGRVYGFVDGRACSAATIVLAACDQIVMARGAVLMIHEASAEMSGRVDDFEDAIRIMKNANDEIVKCYLPRWRGTEADLRAALAAETWFTAEEAVAVGLADSVSSTIALAAHLDSRHKYKNIPSALAIAAHGADQPNMDRANLFLHRAICI